MVASGPPFPWKHYLPLSLTSRFPASVSIDQSTDRRQSDPNSASATEIFYFLYFNHTHYLFFYYNRTTSYYYYRYAHYFLPSISQTIRHMTGPASPQIPLDTHTQHRSRPHMGVSHFIDDSTVTLPRPRHNRIQHTSGLRDTHSVAGVSSRNTRRHRHITAVSTSPSWSASANGNRLGLAVAQLRARLTASRSLSHQRS